MSFLETRVAREEAAGQKPSVWLHNTRDTLLEIHLAEKNAEAMWTTLKGGPTGSRLEWQVNARTTAGPTALVKLGN